MNLVLISDSSSCDGSRPLLLHLLHPSQDRRLGNKPVAIETAKHNQCSFYIFHLISKLCLRTSRNNIICSFVRLINSILLCNHHKSFRYKKRPLRGVESAHAYNIGPPLIYKEARARRCA